MNKIDDLLKTTLLADVAPDDTLNTSIIRQAKEMQTMKHKPFKFSVAAASVIGILTFGSVTAFAAYYLLAPSQVAGTLTESTSLEKAFESKNAVNVNETQISSGYKITLMGLVTGKELLPTIKDQTQTADLTSSKTYAVVAIEKEDGSSMPNVSDDAYKTFCLSPLIHGKSFNEINNGSLNASVSSFTQDGIQYELLECDDLEIFSEMGVQLGVVNEFGNETEAYKLDKKAGKFTQSPDYDELNALFDLPLDTKKADPAAAEKYFLSANNKSPSSEESTDADTISANPEVQEWIQHVCSENVSVTEGFDYLTKHATPDNSSVQTLYADNDHAVSWTTSDGAYSLVSVQNWNAPAGQTVVVGVDTDDTLSGTGADTLTLNNDGSFTYKRYNAK